MSKLNLLLALAAAIVWGGGIFWYTHKDIRNAWNAYRRRWTS